MNPLSLLPPPPSNFFKRPTITTTIIATPRNQHPAGCQQPATNEPGRRAVRVRVRVLFTARARIGRSTLKILFFLLAYIPNPHLLYVLYTRHDRRACSSLPCVMPFFFFVRLLFLNFFLLPSRLPHFSELFLQPPLSSFYPRLSARTATSSGRVVLSRDQRDKVPLPRRSRFLSCGKLVPLGRLRASLYYALATL